MEKFVSFLGDLVFLILYIILIYYFLHNKKINKYVKGVFLTCLFFRVINWLFQVFVYRFPVESIRNLFGWEGNFQFILNYFNTTSFFLLIFGLSLLIGKDYIAKNEQVEYPTMGGYRRNIGVLLLLFVITFGIYIPFWLYRIVKDLKNNFEDDIPYTPGKAVGFLFIPVFNIYWGFYILFSLPLKIKQIENKYYNENVGFHFHAILIPILLIVFSTILSFQIQLEFDKPAYGSILFFESAIFVLWLTVQAKLNSFFDFAKEPIVNK